MTIRGMLAVLMGIVLALGVGAPARAQQMFLDTDGDGIASARDHLMSEGLTSVGVWIETNARQGAAPCAAKGLGDTQLTINSYEFILSVEGGEVRWGKFSNALPTMSNKLGPLSNRSDFYAGRLGSEKLPAGKYKLGTLDVTVVSGSPALTFASRTNLWQGALTSFGSQYPGKDGDNTLKLAITAPGDGRMIAGEGDWSATVGLTTRTVAERTDGEAPGNASLQFGARVTQGAGGRGRMQLVITTTKVGSLYVRLYDVSGRLVRMLADSPSVDVGEHIFPIDPEASGGSRLSAAIYYFRVDASEGVRTGKLAVVR